ncbi:MAG: glycosyltransferase, exosortase A system-associated [Candidatus Rokubacteria bacterium]|nr:glycosyltransferase, exosortase A system-associated [Candidatus Rokubacteria bacterium]
MSPRRILHVLDHSLPIGSGYSYRSRSIVMFQRRLGLEPLILTSPKQGTAADCCDTIEGIRHHRTGQPGGRMPFLRELLLMRRLAGRIGQVARAERVDLLHAHSPVLNGLPAIWAGRRLGLPVVYEVRTFWEDAAVNHGTYAEGSLRYRMTRVLETLAVKQADRVVAICEGIRGELLRRGVPRDRVTVVPNGVDADWFEPRERATALAARLGLGEGPVFGYVGSFSRYENLPFLARAAPDFLRRLPGGRLLLVGGGRDETALREAALEAGPGVILTGRIPHDQVRGIYTLLDVLVLPRRRIRLTELVTPLKPLEAMAMGKPVLASDIGGHAELIRDGETGVLFRAEDRESLVTEAVRLGEHPMLRQRLGETGRRFVEAERTWDRVVAGYLDVYGSAA